MKCPYQTKVIHIPEYIEGYVIHRAKDITEFDECVKNKCPFYYTSLELEHCHRAENEYKK